MSGESPIKSSIDERCQITGAAVPASEMIDFLGFRVGAQGKAILLEHLKCGIPLPGVLETPPFSARLMAFMLDSFLMWLFGYVLMIIIIAIIKVSGSADIAVALTYLGLIAGPLLYTWLFHAFNGGQTPGKSSAHLRVVHVDGSRLTFSRAGARAVVYQAPVILIALSLAGFVLYAASGTNQTHTMGMVGMFALLIPLSGAYFIANCVFTLFNKPMQTSIHDRLTSTRVVVTLDPEYPTQGASVDATRPQ